MYGSTPESAPAYYQPQPPAQRQQTDGMAIASFVLGLCWAFWVGSILAVVFGHISIHNAKTEGRKPSGMAVAGMILGYVGVASAAFVILVSIMAAAGSGN